MKFKLRLILIVLAIFLMQFAYAVQEELAVPTVWSRLAPILMARINQNKPKMKLSKNQAFSFVHFLEKLNKPTPKLEKLETILPKTTLELLMAVHERGLGLGEAEKMAVYLEEFVEACQFQNVAAFDENTSHIIGREWQEIDYAGENMTWQKQRLKYLPYGVTDFKTEGNLMRFFKLESHLPYFSKIYRAKSNCIQG